MFLVLDDVNMAVLCHYTFLCLYNMFPFFYIHRTCYGALKDQKSADS